MPTVPPPPPLQAPQIQTESPTRRTAKKRPGSNPAMKDARIRRILLSCAGVFVACIVIVFLGSLIDMAEGEFDLARSATTIVLGPFVITAMTAAYFFPTMVAYFRGHRNLMPISILNLALGWMFFGWIGALIWASTDTQK